jgi:hypothetical protein
MLPETDSDVTPDSDVTADTAHFRAFATRRDDDLPAPWQMRAKGSTIGILALVVVAAAVLAAIFGTLLT